ncbi:MAG: YIP1 family protein [Gemmatimonadota bacterium]|nr:YIP1 family protein [Gemmatimonadota bacterium]
MAFVDRVKNILLSPRTEWQVIDAEPATVSSLYTGYIMPLFAIPTICRLIGSAVFGMNLGGFGRFRTPIGTALIGAVVSYIVMLVMVYVFAFVINALAPTFGGTKNMVQALKVAAYASTAASVAGILSIFGFNGFLSFIQLLISLYSLYLLYLGLAPCMKSPADKSAGYTIVVIIAMFIIGAILGVVLGTLGMAGLMGGGGMGTAYPRP